MITSVHHSRPDAVIIAHGEDAQDYLQSQWSVDLSASSKNLAAYGLRLNRKGRVLADGFLLREQEERFQIVSYHCKASEVIDLLNENVVADDVEFEDETSGKEIFTIWGEGIGAICKTLDFVRPPHVSFLQSEVGLVFNGRRTHPANIEILANESQAEKLYHLLKKAEAAGRLRFCDSGFLNQTRIESRIPAIPIEIGPDELPHEGGLETDAVDFEKGCFLGQEVMARLKSMGQIQRGLIPVKIKSTLPENLPAKLFLKEKNFGLLKSYFTAEIDSRGLGMALVRLENLPEIKTKGLSFSPSEEPRIFPI